jgi:ribosomal subunit interface protein
MDVSVRGRHLDVSEKFRDHATEKLQRIGRYDPRLSAVDVSVVREQNPRVSEPIRVELTVKGSGPVVRAEASAGDKFGAFDAALAKLEERMRRAHDKRLSRTQNRPSLSDAVSALSPTAASVAPGSAAESGESAAPDEEPRPLVEAIGDGPLVVREKFHDPTPITLDDALHHMELVGHDFYLFVDKEVGLPSVVYRRRGYDYGVLRLGDAQE